MKKIDGGSIENEIKEKTISKAPCLALAIYITSLIYIPLILRQTYKDSHTRIYTYLSLISVCILATPHLKQFIKLVEWSISFSDQNYPSLLRSTTFHFSSSTTLPAFSIIPENQGTELG